MPSDYQEATRLTIHTANCLRSLSPLAACSLCQDVCPQKALSWQNDTWTATDCTRCGLCVAVCPTQVFQLDYPALLQQQTGQPLSVCCNQNSQAPAQALRINCLQQLSPLTLVHLLYQYGQITLYLSPEACQQCPQQWYAQSLLLQLQQYHLPADKLQIVTQTPDVQTTATRQSGRRGFLHNLLQQTENRSKKAILQAADHFITDPAPQQKAAIFPARLPLYALYIKRQLSSPPDASLPFRQLQCTACNFCGACTHLCPTQALTMTETETQRQLQFHPELCINCNLCQTICMQHGLRWDDWMTQEQFLQTPQLLAHSAKQCCVNCGHDYYQWPADDESCCSFCR